jgi:hypothetical protein
LLKTTPSAKPGEPPKEKSYLLREGERQDDLEVLVIDENIGAVKVRCAGTEMTVNFKDNAVATAAPAPPVPGPPGAPATSPGVPAARPGVPGPPLSGANPAFQAQIPPRPVRANASAAAPLDPAANFGGHEPGHGYDEHGL